MKNNKTTQYAKILTTLLIAGKKGCTTLDLIKRVGSTCPHKRIAEMPVWHRIGSHRYYLEKGWRTINSRRVRVYSLVRL